MEKECMKTLSMTESELEETLKILYEKDRYLYDCLCIELMERDKQSEELRHWVDWSKDLIRINQVHRQNKEWEFRLFKKSVREFVGEDTYKLITDKYNLRITEFRNSGKRKL